MAYCTTVLEKDPNSVKSYFRRAKAKEGLEEYDAAVVSLEKGESWKRARL